MNSIQEYLKKITGKKNVYNLIIAILIGIMIILVSDFFLNTSTPTSANVKEVGKLSSNSDKSSSTDESDINQYEKEKKTELTSLLKKMKGVGDVDVMIYCNEGEELVPATNSNKSDTDTKETDTEGGKRTQKQKNDDKTVVTSSDDGGSTPFIVKKISPQITGVVVVAEGADDDEIKQSITTAVSGLFGIPGYQVYVYPMKN
ncbi:stage III sporulation protein AG [Clostridium oryzae]|uniref:Stage III sporulation protein AG n=1 Tax=Clostridium oryzae TaxID=1450648 RepID=A0A1V4ITU0_9CLOT|nr:stage III sporulation protein AG [Clostridium oryzae]OPJ63205.1 hypothetical protein CLORY_12880 [Clostridium oryzae]